MTDFAVEFRQVTKRYGSSTAVKKLDLGLTSGRMTTLIGPSGCGKTTTLKMINRLIEPSTGTILVEGRDTNEVDSVELRRNIGYVIQQIGLFPHMTIEENIALVPRLRRGRTRDFVRRTEELLDLVGLDPAQFRHRYPNELSGGQQQRIGVARALAAEPSIILMDEPFSALDPISREQLQDELVKLQDSLHKTIIFVTHDMDEALKIADEIVLMKDGEVVQHGTPEDLLRHPHNDFVREFVGVKRFEQAPFMQQVKDVMNPAVTVLPKQGLAQAVHLMRRRKVNGLIVTDQSGKYLGVVGAPEIYEHYGNEQAKVVDVMSRTVPSVTEEDTVSSVLSTLHESDRGFLPVVRPDGRLAGAVTRASVIDALSKPYRNDDDDVTPTVDATSVEQGTSEEVAAE
ncbi:betaine/proline/choline family ABC transporter ATP-binding protein [Alicyclobacillus dauci]|uniref:Quaternary amine transport ATP-binding protein n=1 Tax=Alicyclobacillus dauci TaxID=1475485 RepID=A0ABY6Z254_9BACL|nr:betaine/proline/choline family ABC transporter ATP-binding protein [Alicyclobacillus dauci]WAH36296.1 betaine/proline/choline family ABC transporter ATP-binding protein [Alicyclobacillus dauci]